MKDIARQIAVVVTTVATIIVNLLANALPINNLTTKVISDSFNVYFVPAGYVFAIWGLIYLGLIAYAIFQALPSQRTNPRLQAVGWWVALSGVANSVWIFLWHYQQFPLTIVAMLVLLCTLIITYLNLRIGKPEDVSQLERWTVHVPFSIYLGWITVATVANITSLLDYLKWDGFGLDGKIWMVIVLVAVFVIAALMNFTRRDVAYTLVILWALAGITFNRYSNLPEITIPTWITFALVLVTLAAALFLNRSAKKPV